MLAVFCDSLGFNPEVTMIALRLQINGLSHRGVEFYIVRNQWRYLFEYLDGKNVRYIECLHDVTVSIEGASYNDNTQTHHLC